MSSRPRGAAVTAAWRARLLILAAVDDGHATRAASAAQTLLDVAPDVFLAAVARVREASTMADAWRVALAYDAEWKGAGAVADVADV